MAEPPAQRFVTPFEDSRRWRNIARRPGDIIISTPPKSGTTWTQEIVRSLLWPDGAPPGGTHQLSPWIDMRMTPIEELAIRLERQTHRRFLKTHSPGDAIPFDKTCRYIVVYRDGRDALVSWANHRSSMRPEIFEVFNAVAAESAVEPVEPYWNGDYDVLLDEWLRIASSLRHLASWWPRRHEPNVLFVHYADLSQDLVAEMRRIAAFLDLSIEPSAWPHLAARCGLDRMRAAAEAEGEFDGTFRGGARSFFHRGTNGRWREVLTNLQVERYLQLVAELLPDDAAAWLERGSIDLGARPEHVGVADTTSLDTSAWHPVFSRLAKRPLGSIDAIAERRVAEARAAGLFDNLALHGKPIPDIDRQRAPGWWTDRFVARERNKVEALELEGEIRQSMLAMWRLGSDDAVAAAVQGINEQIERYNLVSDSASIDPIDSDAALATWRRLRNP